MYASRCVFIKMATKKPHFFRITRKIFILGLSCNTYVIQETGDNLKELSSLTINLNLI